MDNTRFNRWVKASPGLAPADHFLAFMSQEVGRLDSRLSEENSRFIDLSPEEKATIENSIKLTDLMMYSRLWILAAYELIRTLDEMCRNNSNLFDGNSHTEIYELKHSFARIRMPLAKLQPADKHKNTDGPIAQPILHRKLGVGWQVSRDVVITRQELSENLLGLLEKLRNLSD